MKKLFLLFVFIVTFSNVFAQRQEVVEIVGINTAFLNSSHSSSPLIKGTAPIMSINFGVIDNFNYGNFAIRTGLVFTGKGGTYNENSIPKNLRIYYFEAPADFIYQEHKGKDGIFFGAGPYFSAGFGGKLYVGDPKKAYTDDLNLYKKAPLFRTGDIGAEGIIGYKLKSGCVLDLNYNEGFANILTNKANSNDTKSLMNRSFGVSVGYPF
ncbi:hypothetical protein [Mucilaginibacter pocheonensis]|uniref:Outer membrane protein beta-barrel domain-containing protein n=1 Tax=Mucilaginibacter pocheonensis TaxID=398050 RepID=A0ABU1T7D0_9SPHI|nr:hypothetical protein [Mucilaginibacter pocheonensis]MDR6941307.1 hypothetical protein [Mucilaginibacter pocheonensis]